MPIPPVDRPREEGWFADVPPRPPDGVVRDSLTFEQAEAYYRLLTHAAEVDRDALAAAAATTQRERFGDREPQQFADLLSSPDWWQGRPICVRGHVNRLVAIPAPENQFGIQTFYEAWLVSPDSQRYPTVLIAASVPDGMPIGEEVISGVSACGYVFKLHAYPARDGKGRLAPMIMTGRLDWNPPQSVEPPLSRQSLVILLGLLAAAVVAGLVALSRRRPRRRFAAVDDAAIVDDGSAADFLDDLEIRDSTDDASL